MATFPNLDFERTCDGVIAGVDEAGCAPFAGPVVAAAVILPSWKRKPASLRELNDSKQLTFEQRERLYQVLTQISQFGVGIAEVTEIDKFNIYQANMLAMRRAIAQLPIQPDVVLVDGNRDPKPTSAVKLIVKGDTLSLSIAAASVIAKVTRDRIMIKMAEEYDGYGWRRNMGYGTDEHYLGLLRLGPTPFHRRSFAPVAAFFAKESLRLELRFQTPAEITLGEFRLIQLREDLHAVFNTERYHIGILKAKRGNWFFKSISYSEQGWPIEGSGPYALFHNQCVSKPCEKVLQDFFRTKLG